MKVQLREHVRVGGESTRHVDITVNWDRRIVVLADGRWVPFEGVTIGDPEPPFVPFTAGKVAHVLGHPIGPNDSVRFTITPNSCIPCNRSFKSKAALAAHRRWCPTVNFGPRPRKLEGQ